MYLTLPKRATYRPIRAEPRPPLLQKPSAVVVVRVGESRGTYFLPFHVPSLARALSAGSEGTRESAKGPMQGDRGPTGRSDRPVA